MSMVCTMSAASEAVPADHGLVVSNCIVSKPKDALTLVFQGIPYIFHAQWLHDARCDKGSGRRAATAFCQQLEPIYIQAAKVSDTGVKSTIDVTWEDGSTTSFPAVWLQMLAPLVAKGTLSVNGVEKDIIPKGWLVNELVIPELSYHRIAGANLNEAEYLATKAWILETLLLDGRPGIIKIVDLPEADAYKESSQANNLVTAILKRLFGEVFQHSMRAPDTTFIVASQSKELANGKTELPNYDTAEILLPHSDHSHYENPVRVQGLHAVEGHSENTFIHAFAALQTLRDEDPDLYEALCSSPYILGRVAQFYAPPLYQTAVDTAVRSVPGYPDQIKCIRWHPHLAGYLLTPYEQYERARRAHCKFQEIQRRDSHQLTVKFNPGDMYIWDNFKLLHGRERILSTPRLAIGQTVIEQVVNDHYRVSKMRFLTKYIGEHWLVQTPTRELENLVGIIKKAEEAEKAAKK